MRRAGKGKDQVGVLQSVASTFHATLPCTRGPLSWRGVGQARLCPLTPFPDDHIRHAQDPDNKGLDNTPTPKSSKGVRDCFSYGIQHMANSMTRHVARGCLQAPVCCDALLPAAMGISSSSCLTLVARCPTFQPTMLVT